MSSIDSKGIDASNGRLHDTLIGDIIVWKQHEFHAWWNAFENLIDHPLSRVFVNAFVDSLELKGPLNGKQGLFAKRKFDKELKALCRKLGWGFVNREQRCVTQSAHPLLSVAFAQYTLELFEQCRYKVRWIEPQPQMVQLEIETSNNLPSPNTHEVPPWSKDEHRELNVARFPVLDAVNEYELKLDGERVLLIPLQAIERFLVACKPYASPPSLMWFESNIPMADSDQHLLQTTISSVASMFLESNRPVYIIDESSWQSYIEHYLHEYGWGSFNVIMYDATTFEFHASLNKGPMLPFTLGILCGMWERAHGRTYRVSLYKENDIFHVKIHSFLDYQNT
ncbi:MAG: hypothetical protein CMB70_05380 [Euryarchaeota archaeon]|nr:hypothetical protein [Euryarchaeota archaeon]